MLMYSLLVLVIDTPIESRVVQIEKTFCLKILKFKMSYPVTMLLGIKFNEIFLFKDVRIVSSDGNSFIVSPKWYKGKGNENRFHL